MPVLFYMDVHVPEAVTTGLRRRNLDILTSQSDGTRRFNDEDLLSRATELGRVLYTQDAELLHIAQDRQEGGIAFGGVVFSPQQGVSIGQIVEDLYLLAV